MKKLSHKSIPELQAFLGEQLKQLRISKDVDQITTAERAGISEKSLRNLEDGTGSSIGTLLKVLKALDALETLQLLAPQPSTSPVALFKYSKVRRRVRRQWRKSMALSPLGPPDEPAPPDVPAPSGAPAGPEEP